MRLALNERGAIALEQLASKLNCSSAALRAAYKNLSKEVGTELEGMGIVKDFFENETNTFHKTIEELALVSEQIVPRMLLTAEKIREYIESNNGESAQQIIDNHHLRSALSHSVRRPILPNNNGRWSNPARPGNSVWIPSTDSFFSWRDHTVVRLTPYREILHKYNIVGITYRFNCPVFDRFVDTCIGEVYLENMPNMRYGKKGAHYLANVAVTQNPSSVFYKKTPEEVHEYMQNNNLVWHEKEDMHTLQPIPKELNAAFRHTGGIGYRRQTLKLAKRIENKIGKKWRLVKGKLKSSSELTKIEKRR